MVKSNCYKCQNRHYLCHSRCEDYKRFVDNLQKIKEIKKLERAAIPLYKKNKSR